MSQHDKLLQQASAAHRTQLLIQWGCGVGALAVTIGSLCLAYQPGAKLKTVTPIMLLGCALSLSAVALGEAQRRDYELARDTHQNMKRVLGFNAASWLNLMTQPNKTALRQIEAISTVSPALPLFDWGELADADDHPTLAIISKMGGGKSRLAKFLARHILFPGQSPELRAIDIYGRGQDWQDATLVTDHGAMVEMMKADIQAIGDRVELYREGQDDFNPLFWVFEEAPDTIGTLRKSSKENDALVTAWFTKATTVARKVKARLCLVSVRLSGAEIGVSAETRNDATVIFPGHKGIAKAMADDRIFKLGSKQNRETREQITAALDGVKRPALVYADGKWYPASIPELDAAGNPIDRISAGRSLPGSPTQPRQDAADLQVLKARLNALRSSEKSGINQHSECAEMTPDETINQWVESYQPEMSMDGIAGLKSLASYCQNKGEVAIDLVLSSWARNKNFSRTAARDFLAALAQMRLIKIVGERVVWV
jgi:hypothetical protein